MNDVMPLRAVYLFGSHARGEAGPDSDVDLASPMPPDQLLALDTATHSRNARLAGTCLREINSKNRMSI